jgi:glutathione peroxidase
MTIKQKILKKFYPVLMLSNKILNKYSEILINKNNKIPSSSFYDLKAVSISNNEIHFDEFKDKKVLIVNTASDCGYTAQYNELQKLYENNKEKLVVLGFPSNNFGNQEKGSEKEIAEFCKINFGISFPLMKKTNVVKNSHQNDVFEWLTYQDKNGWNNHQPEWNFCKYFVNEKGILTHYFGPAVSPLDSKVLSVL